MLNKKNHTPQTSWPHGCCTTTAFEGANGAGLGSRRGFGFGFGVGFGAEAGLQQYWVMYCDTPIRHMAVMRKMMMMSPVAHSTCAQVDMPSPIASGYCFWRGAL